MKTKPYGAVKRDQRQGRNIAYVRVTRGFARANRSDSLGKMAIYLIAAFMLLVCPPAQVNGQILHHETGGLTTGWGALALGSSANDNLPPVQFGRLPLRAVHRISLDLRDVSLETALLQIADKAGVRLVYGHETVATEKRVTLQATAMGVRDALQQVLQGTDIHFVMSSSGRLVLFQSFASRMPAMTFEPAAVKIAPPAAMPVASLRAGTITGTVTERTSGAPIPGANVVIVGTSQGAATDTQGQYTITGVEPGSYTLSASFIGYVTETQENVVVQEGEATEVDFVLEQNVVTLGEAVAIGYGEQAREDITGSISSVDAEDLQAIQTANLAEAFQGQAAGVLVTQSSGAPGSDMDIVIRGASTLGSTDPLYVVDGVPIEGDLSDLNMGNVESVEILKDASASAIYGSRAANGVVLITTDRGVSGGIITQFTARGGVSYVPEGRRIDMMTTEQFYQYSVEAYTNAGLPIPEAWQEPYLSQNLQTNTDWQDQLFRSASVQDYNLSISGGGDHAIYSFSGGYLTDEGNVVGSSFDRVSLRVNSEFSLGKDDRFRIGENIGLSRTNLAGDSGTDTFKEVYQQSPTVALRCPENLGGFCGPTSETSPGFRLNQVALLHLEDNNEITQRLIGSVYAEYDILPNLTYRLNLGGDLASIEDESFTPLYDLKSNVNTSRDLAQTRAERRALILENTLNYDVRFADVHEFDVLAGFTQEQRRYESVSASAQGFQSDILRTINAATGQTTVSGGATESALRSLLGRVQYEYADRYRAQFAIRRDGSSRFGRARRWGTFPSASVGWSLHNESFMSGIDGLSRLMLRGSWGVTGAQQIPDFAAIATVRPVANYIFGEEPRVVPGAAPLALGNSSLQWQETEQVDVGLDFGFFDERLTFTVDYFRKNTSNVLLRPPVVTSSGIWRNQGAFTNLGEVNNSGFEFSGGYVHYFGDLMLEAKGNLATMTNEVMSLGGEIEEVIVTVSDELGYGQTITRPGSEVGAFYGYISEGPFRDQADVDNHAEQPGAEPGDLKFRDLNGDGVIDANDRTIIGSPFPDFFYGLLVNLEYKNLGLRMQMDGVQGRDIFALRSDNDVKGFNNATAAYLDRWTPDNPDGEHPRAHTTDPNSNLRSSTYRVENGSYLALRNVTLSYDIPSNLLQRLGGLRTLRVFVGANNLAWFTPYTGYNPEIGAGDGEQASLTRSLDSGSYPIAVTYELGLRVGF